MLLLQVTLKDPQKIDYFKKILLVGDESLKLATNIQRPGDLVEARVQISGFE